MVRFHSKNVRKKVEGYLKVPPLNGINVFVSLSYRALDFGPGNPKTGQSRLQNIMNGDEKKKKRIKLTADKYNYDFKYSVNFRELGFPLALSQSV